MVRSLVGAAHRGRPRAAATSPGWSGSPPPRARHGEVLVMPARGLTLEEVGYPADDRLAARALEARATRTSGGPVSHYFHTPEGPVSTRQITAHIWGMELSVHHRRRRVLRGPPGPRHGRPAAGIAAPRGGSPAGPGLRLRPHRGGTGRGLPRASPSTPSTSTPSPSSSPASTPPPPGSPTGYGATAPDDVAAEVRYRRDLVQPAHPDRQGGPARAPAHVAPPPRARRRGAPRGEQEPRRRLAAALARSSRAIPPSGSPRPRASGSSRCLPDHRHDGPGGVNEFRPPPDVSQGHS